MNQSFFSWGNWSYCLTQTTTFIKNELIKCNRIASILYVADKGGPHKINNENHLLFYVFFLHSTLLFKMLWNSVYFFTTPLSLIAKKYLMFFFYSQSFFITTTPNSFFIWFQNLCHAYVAEERWNRINFGLRIRQPYKCSSAKMYLLFFRCKKNKNKARI